MSMGGEMMEQMYDEHIRAFLKKLEARLLKCDDDYMTVWNIIDEYNEHFKNFGIYGESKTED